MSKSIGIMTTQKFDRHYCTLLFWTTQTKRRLQLLQLLQLLQELQVLQQLSMFRLFCKTNNSNNKKFVLLPKSTFPSSSTGLVRIDNSKTSSTSLLKFIYFPPNNIFLSFMLQISFLLILPRIQCFMINY